MSKDINNENSILRSLIDDEIFALEQIYEVDERVQIERNGLDCSTEDELVIYSVNDLMLLGILYCAADPNTRALSFYSLC